MEFIPYVILLISAVLWAINFYYNHKKTKSIKISGLFTFLIALANIAGIVLVLMCPKVVPNPFTWVVSDTWQIGLACFFFAKVKGEMKHE